MVRPPDVRTIIERSVEANQRDWNAAPQYADDELDCEPNGGTKTFHVTMILGSPYSRLIAVNGHPLSPSDQRTQQKKLNAAIAERRDESSSARAKRVASYEKGRRRDRSMMQQLTAAFDFKLTGEEKMGNREVYILKATPRPGYHPPNMQTEVLTGMRGTLWIDKDSFQWVKVEAEVVSPVSIAGFLATVEPGTRFELEKAPVTPEVWLPSHFKMQSTAKVLGLFHNRKSADETYSNYRPAAGSGGSKPVQ